MVSTPNSSVPKFGAKTKVSRSGRKIAEIEGAEDVRFSPGNTESGKSDGDADADDLIEQAGSSIMLDEVLDLLSKRWDRINGAQALKLLPKDTKLQVMIIGWSLQQSLGRQDCTYFTKIIFMLHILCRPCHAISLQIQPSKDILLSTSL